MQSGLLLFLMALTLGGTSLLYFQEKPSADVVFSTEAHLISLSANAISFSAPKGTKRIRLTTDDGAEYFIDCLAIPSVCADAAGTMHPVNIRAYALSSKFIWPVSVTQQGRSVASLEESKRMYNRYLEQERNMVLRLGITLAAVFFFFAIKLALRK